MIKKLLIITIFLSINLFGKGTEKLEIDELESFMQRGIIIIDIREEKEWKKTGIVPSSYRLTYEKNGKNEKKWIYILVRLLKDKDRSFVLISKEGKRAKSLATKLLKEKKFNNSMYLKGGINAWIDADRNVINF